MRVRLICLLCVTAIAGCSGPTAPTTGSPFPQLIGDWSGTLTVNRTLPDGSSGVNVCAQRWTISSQTGSQFSGTFELSGGTVESCQQTGDIQGTVTTAGGVTQLLTNNTAPRLACTLLSRAGMAGLASTTSFRAEWAETLVCNEVQISRTLAVAMSKS